MKYIKVHTPIQMRNPVNNLPLAEAEEYLDEETNTIKLRRDDKGNPIAKVLPPWSFYDILTRFVFQDKNLGKGKALAKTVKRLTKAFKEAQPGNWVLVDDADLEALKKVVENNEWPSIINGQLGEFFDSLDNASDDFK